MMILIGVSIVLSVLLNWKSYTINNMMECLGGLAGLFIWVIWLFFMIWIFTWVFHLLPHSSPYYHRDFWDHDNAVEILRERYAKDQFDQMLADLHIERKK